MISVDNASASQMLPDDDAITVLLERMALAQKDALVCGLDTPFSELSNVLCANQDNQRLK